MRILNICVQFILVLLLQNIQMGTSIKYQRHLATAVDDTETGADPIPDEDLSKLVSTLPPTVHVPTILYENPPSILPPSLESASNTGIGNNNTDSNNFMNISTSLYMNIGGVLIIFALLTLVWRILRRFRSSSNASLSRDASQYSRIPQSDGDIEFGLKSNTRVVNATDDDDEEGDWEEWETKNSKNIMGNTKSNSTNIVAPINTTIHSSKSSVASNSGNDLRHSSQSTPTKMSPIASEASLKSQSFDTLPTAPTSSSSNPSSKPKKNVPPPVPTDVDLFAVRNTYLSMYIIIFLKHT